jgi:nuclear pore complex protein Nup107
MQHFILSNCISSHKHIYSERILERSPGPSARELLTENPFTPPSTLAQAIIHVSPFLEELMIVREWVQDIAPVPQNPGAAAGYWSTTKHAATGAMFTNIGGTAAKDGLVTALDPDVVNRTEGRTHLSVDDTVSPDLLGL